MECGNSQHLRMIAVVPFVSSNDVAAVFEELCGEIRNAYNADVDEILDYIENSYIRRYRRNASGRPLLFPIEMWSIFYRKHQEMARAYNHIEG